MPEKRLFVLSLIGIVILSASTCSVFGKAPDTPKIVFGSYRDGNHEIYMMNPDGTEQTNLTNYRADDISPVWSPTGEHILFISDREQKAWGTWDLYLMDPDGSNVQRWKASNPEKKSST